MNWTAWGRKQPWPISSHYSVFVWEGTSKTTVCALTEIQTGDLLNTKLCGTDRQTDRQKQCVQKWRSFGLRSTPPHPTLGTMSVYQRTGVSQLFKMQMELWMLSLQQWTPLETQIESNMGTLCNWMQRDSDYMNISTGVVEGARVLPYFSGLTL